MKGIEVPRHPPPSPPASPAAASPSPAIGWPPGLAELFTARRVELTRLAHLITGSSGIAEDLVQAAFVRLRPVWAGVDDPVPYVRRIVVNLAHGHLRHQRVVERRAPLLQ